MKKAKIELIIYQKEGKTKVKFKNKKGKNASKEISNLYLVLSNSIKDILNKI